MIKPSLPFQTCFFITNEKYKNIMSKMSKNIESSPAIEKIVSRCFEFRKAFAVTHICQGNFPLLLMLNFTSKILDKVRVLSSNLVFY